MSSINRILEVPIDLDWKSPAEAEDQQMDNRKLVPDYLMPALIHVFFLF